MPQSIRVDVSPSDHVSAVLYPSAPADAAGVTMILGHGAGANQNSGFMVSYAEQLAARGIDTVTFNFLYTERRRRLPDRNDALEACYRSVIDAFADRVAHQTSGRNRVAIGGKSMGGRIASQVAAKHPVDLLGLVFLGYPLHPPGKPEQLRSKHLSQIRAPMLFVQGSRDAFGTPEELQPIVRNLPAPVELYVVDGGDHSFKVAKKSGVPQQQVHGLILDHVAQWLRAHR